MKVPSLKEFAAEQAATVEMLAKYLAVELAQNLREVTSILKRLTFAENFECFEFSGTIEANSELAIRNELRGGAVPTRRIILRGDTYSMAVVDGDTQWTKNYVYLKNTDAMNDSVVTVLFLK